MIAEALLAFTLNSGIYECPGNPNICDQKVRVYKSGETITALKVEYIGWCGSMGPYMYYCTGNICEDGGNARFTIKENSDSYHWQNLGHPYECNYQTKSSVEPF